MAASCSARRFAAPGAGSSTGVTSVPEPGPPVYCGELAERGGQVQLCAPVEEIARQIFGALLATTDRPRPQRRPSMETARGRRTPRRAGVPVRLVPGSAK